MKQNFLGKFRAFVTNVYDPEERGRIKVKCPSVFGAYESGWCEMCIPHAQDGTGDFSVPSPGEAVWIEFEDGDINFPVYTGGWYASSETPFTDYQNDVDKKRVIGYNGVKLVFTQDNMEVVVGEKAVNFSPDFISDLSMVPISVDSAILGRAIVDSVKSGDLVCQEVSE